MSDLAVLLPGYNVARHLGDLVPRIRRELPDADTRPASFGGHGGHWYIFADADCPAVSSSVVFSWAKKTDDPVADVPCVDR